MKTNPIKLNILAIVASCAFFAFSCSSPEKAKEVNEEDVAAAAFNEAEAEIENEIDKVIHDLPSPSEVPFLLQATGADFRAEFVNDLSKIETYLTSNDKSALNLGVYAADVGYLSTYNQAQEALNYMEGCQKMSEKIGISSAFDVRLLSRFEKNIGNNDSLTALINDAIEIAEQKLEAGDRLTMAALVLAGSFVEGLYISSQVIEQYPSDQLSEANRDIILEPLMKIVLDQKKSLLDLISVLKHVEQDEMLENISADMNTLRFQYNELTELTDKISSNSGGVVLHQHDLKNLTAEIKRIRKDITD